MPDRRILSLAAAAALSAYALLAWRFDFLCDDAFISFRYARNLALGEGLRYNPGLPPVEGYSNFLWVLWLAPFERAGLDVPLVARVSSALLGAMLVVWVTLFCARRFELSGGRALATGLFLATLPPVALWATGGLATMPAALCVFGTYERLLGDPARPRGGQAGLFALAAALVRADGAVWVALVLAAGGALWLLDGRPASLRRALLRAALVCAAGLALHVAWRLSYYGDWLPNTARVKAGFSPARLARGLDYVAATLLTVPSLVLAALAALRALARAQRHVWLSAGFVIAGTLSYAAWVGGDFMPMGRFLFPAVPFVALLFALALRALAARAAAALAAVCIALSWLACFDLGPLPASIRARFHFRADREWESEVAMWRGMKERARDWAVQGRALKLLTRPGESMIFGPLGALGYYSELIAYDTYGLVTPEVLARGEPVPRSSPGHDRRVDPDFFFPLHPTYLGSLVQPADAPLDEGLAARWEAHPWSRLVTIERHPLPVGPGFPAGRELRLLRMRRWE